jgi:RND family efflux transporter MFP subunit
VVAVVALVVVAALAGLFFVGYIPRQHRLAEVHREASEVNDGKPNVDVAIPKRSAKTQDVILPADVRSNQETSIFPRANGYLKGFAVDIGDRVKAGQLLAEISAPDLDAELLQAKASVEQARANLVKAQNDLDLAQATLTRYEGFAKTGGVTTQQLDEKRAAFTQAKGQFDADKANVQAAQASVERLTALQGFEKIYAPFDGVVTARNFDVGALMSASNPTPMFRIADTHVLRVYTNVPQTYVQTVHVGDQVSIGVRNYPNKEFVGTVTRTAAALDPSTRTLRYEVDVPNADGLLYAGMYGEARIKASQEHPPIVIPTSAVVFDSAGTKVWVVDEDGKVHAKAVDVGRDFGTEIEIARGLEGQEHVVTNPGERLADGALVDATLKTPDHPSQQQQPGAPKQSQQASAR